MVSLALMTTTVCQVNGLYFGGELDAEDIRAIQTLKGKGNLWPTNALRGRSFESHENVTIHHFLKATNPTFYEAPVGV